MDETDRKKKQHPSFRGFSIEEIEDLLKVEDEADIEPEISDETKAKVLKRIEEIEEEIRIMEESQ